MSLEQASSSATELALAVALFASVGFWCSGSEVSKVAVDELRLVTSLLDSARSFGALNGCEGGALKYSLKCVYINFAFAKA